MSRVDILLLGCFVPFALRGLWRGFVREAFALAGLAAGTILALQHARQGGQLLEARAGLDPEAAFLLAILGIFVGIVALSAIAGRLARRFVRAVLLGPFDRAAGGLLGLAQGAAIVGLACLGVLRLAPASSAAVAVQGSRLGRSLVALADRLVEAARPYTPLTSGNGI